ncbi:hypothetical protein BSLA_02f4895 [Burkholderia stabilis]|nr:hypothetical protein BSLA_02f4895 [Burkholderia stabilis]
MYRDLHRTTGMAAIGGSASIFPVLVRNAPAVRISLIRRPPRQAVSPRIAGAGG